MIDDDKVTYNEFETKIALSRKSIPAQARPSKVTLREREVTEAEEEERAKKRQAPSSRRSSSPIRPPPPS